MRYAATRSPKHRRPFTMRRSHRPVILPASFSAFAFCVKSKAQVLHVRIKLNNNLIGCVSNFFSGAHLRCERNSFFRDYNTTVCISLFSWRFLFHYFALWQCKLSKRGRYHNRQALCNVNYDSKKFRIHFFLQTKTNSV